ncbi:hypothetical protein ACP70R_015313 [Stipagrostis hirtigluma subsp. patula]
MDGGGGGEEKVEPRVDDPGALGPIASPATAPPADEPNPTNLEEWDRYLTAEEEKHARRMRQFEEQLRASLAKLEERERRGEEEKEKIRQFKQLLRERRAKLEQKAAQLEQDKRRFEQQCRENQAELEEEEARYQRKVEELARLKHDLKILEEEEEKEAQMKLLVRQELQKPLLVQPDEHKNNTNDDTGNLSQSVSLLALASGLIILIQMRTCFSLGYLKYIVNALAGLWALGSIVLSFRIFGRFRGNNYFGDYFARFIYLCSTLLGLYALYRISWWVDATGSDASSSSSSAPATALATVGRDADLALKIKLRLGRN